MELAVVVLLGRLLGIQHVVRYLRNPNPRTTARVLRAFGARVGPGTTLKGRLSIDNSSEDQNSTGDLSRLIIGENCYIGDGVFFDLAANIIIEDGAVISGHVSFLTHAECRRSAFLSKCFPRECADVCVGSGAWVGFGATVTAGVTVGADAAVGAQSLVLSDVESRCLYVGTPAAKLRELDLPK